jgi:NAD-dependent deacetylase
VLFITGAGMSADSGLPTYRGIGGLYDRELTEEGVSIEVALSGQMMRARPELCWKYIAQIEAACRGARPNRGHEVIAALEERRGGSCVLTQNVDGFHRAAGSRNVIDIHGDVHTLICTACDWRDRVADYAALAIPPRCPSCDRLVRPEVVLFGEMLPGGAVAALERELATGFDLVMTIGTTSVFPYIAMPVIAAARSGVPTVEINPGDSEVSDLVDVRFRAGAARVLDQLWQRVDRLAGRRGRG